MGSRQVGADASAAPVSLWGTVLALLVLAVAGAAFIAASLALLAAGRAYVYGEGRWSKAQQEVVFYLDRFAEAGDPADLAHARRALRVPLGDLDARVAMEAPDLERDRARAGLLAGENHPDDISRMIWMFRYFRGAPFVRDAVAAWVASDEHVQALTVLADDLEQQWSSQAPDPEAIVAMRKELARIDGALRLLETRFSQSLGAGMRMLELWGAVLGTAVLLVLALAALGLFGWATRRIRASERKFWASFEHAPLGMALLSAEGTLVDVNDTFCTILGWRRTDLVGMKVEALLHPDDAPEGERILPAVVLGPEGSGAVDKRLVRSDGTHLWGRFSIAEFPDEGRAGRWIAVLEDVSEAKALAEELSHQAWHDPLTGLANRRAFERELDEALRDARSQGTRHTLAFIDLDRFKRVNDSCGHLAGDQALQGIARLMQEQMRTSDVLARLGGDEFGLILRRCPIERGVELIDGLQSALAHHRFVWEGRELTFGSSTGAVEISADAQNPATVMRAADQACYAAKEKGGGRVIARAGKAPEDAAAEPIHPG
jgi:diguanylate cyclase (GGDEF)-like protein/PAS domain S-box-containing protein